MTVDSQIDSKPLIAQSDQSLLLDTHDPLFEEARAELSAFATLEKSPEHFHTYRIDALSLWNAASAGLSSEKIISILERYSRYKLSISLAQGIKELMSRFGKLVLSGELEDGFLHLSCNDVYIQAEIDNNKVLSKCLISEKDGYKLPLAMRGTVKQELIKLGWPALDNAPMVDGAEYKIGLKDKCNNGKPFALREYQKDAIEAFYSKNLPGTGYGVIVMPCGAGKTIMGMGTMARFCRKTLIITTNIAALHQWRDELLDKTDIKAEDIGEYSGATKEIKPITIATYQILTWRPDKESPFVHFGLFRAEDWGLIIYDEVHLLPAPVFRVVAEIQAIKRLGLTATLIREDGLEKDVFSLIGPKRYDVPWKELEQKGFIATAYCKEIRVPLSSSDMMRYAQVNQRAKYRVAAENKNKFKLVNELLEHHKDDLVMIIGQYIEQLVALKKELGVPIITGTTPNSEREKIYSDFKSGTIKTIIVSKVANFAIDLPDASVAIQISGTYGSRQEEAQRLGRILRPKQKNSYFYSIVSHYTVEEEFADNRRRFLTEQGYSYTIEAREDLA